MDIDSRVLRAWILGAGLLALLAIAYFCAYPKVEDLAPAAAMPSAAVAPPASPVASADAPAATRAAAQAATQAATQMATQAATQQAAVPPGATAAAPPARPSPAAPVAAATPATADKSAARVVAAIDAVIKGRTIEFEPGSAELSPAGRALVDELVAPIQADPAARLEVHGHTDNEGDPDFNKSLSLARAGAVRAYLIERGVDGGRIAARGDGAEHPIADNTSYEGRMRNRRVEFRAAE